MKYKFRQTRRGLFYAVVAFLFLLIFNIQSAAASDCQSIAESKIKYKSAIITTDGFLSNQWYLKRIRANKAWDTARESQDIIIAIIDSGIQINHQDLKDNLWVNTKEIPDNGQDDDNNGYIDDVNGWDFFNDNPDPSPKFNRGYTEDGIVHGTVVAGVLAASGNNTVGIAGVTWRAKIMALKALNDNGETDAEKVVKAVNYAIKNKAQIINMSFIGYSNSKEVEKVIQKAIDAGIIVVAAGGNELADGHGHSLDTKPMYPVCYKGVIGVAATDSLDVKTSFSGYGEKCIDISAPGISIFSTSVYAPNRSFNGHPFDKYYDGYWSGTSLAVPMVSGAVALIKQAYPDLTPTQVTEVLLSGSDNINYLNQDYVGKLGWGRLNIEEALRLASQKKSVRKINLVIANYSKPGTVKVLSTKGDKLTEFSAFNNQVNVTTGDLNKDEDDEIIVSSAVAAKPEVRIFNSKGKMVKALLVYSAAVKHAVNVAVADINNDKENEIIVTPGAGAVPEIKIFNFSGKLLGRFLAYPKSFKGGVSVAVGDVDNNGIAEIIAVPASGGNAQVRIFNDKGRLINEFYAYEKNIKSGFNIAVAGGYSSLGSNAKILISPAGGLEPYVKIFNGSGSLVRRFAVANLAYLGGFSTSVADLDGDKKPDMVCGFNNGSPTVLIYELDGRLKKMLSVNKENGKSGIKTAIMYLR